METRWHVDHVDTQARMARSLAKIYPSYFEFLVILYALSPNILSEPALLAKSLKSL